MLNEKQIKKSKLVFPVNSMNKKFKQIVSVNIKPCGIVYLTAVIEYLVAEWVELAGQKTINRNDNKIKTHDLLDVLNDDEELCKIM